MDKLDKLLDQYEDHFGECFPLMLLKGMEDEEIAKEVQKCLDKDEAYAPDPNTDADY